MCSFYFFHSNTIYIDILVSPTLVNEQKVQHYQNAEP